MRLAAAATLIAAFVATAGCDFTESNAARSSATGERDERIGNDPKEQNTGRGSNPAEEIAEPVTPPAGQ